MGIGRIFWSHFQCDHLQPLCHNNSFLRVNNMMRRQIFVSVISTKANTPQFVSLESAALSRPHWIQKLHFLWNGKTKKKILGKCTFRHANDTQTRGGGTPRHALRGAVVTPLRLRGAVVTPMTIPPDTQWHANDTHQKRVSDQNRGQAQKSRTWKHWKHFSSGLALRWILSIVVLYIN
jgi:hypothetical protein